MTKLTRVAEANRKLGIGVIRSNPRTGDAIFCGITAAQEAELVAAVGSAYATASNPCGACFYFDADAERPFRIADDQCGESFASYDELLAAARSWPRGEDH
jgi:hypothetical protein